MLKRIVKQIKKIPDYVVFISTVRGGWYILYIYNNLKIWKPVRFITILYRRFVIRKTRVISVVGSVGKTTTTQVIRQVMLKELRKESYGNFKTSLAENILRCRPRDKHLVLETAIASPGQMATYKDMVRPDVTVVTAIKSDHYKSFPKLEDTRREKVEMVKALGAQGVAILNGDDPNVRWMATQTKARIIFYGMNADNDIRATDIQLNWPKGTHFKLHANGEERDITVSLIGKHMMYTILASIAVGLNEGKSLDEITEKLLNVNSSSGRMEIFHLKNGAILIDDSYKGTMESFFEAFDTMKEITAKRRILLVGKIGHPPGRQGPIYRDLGERASRSADLILFCGEVFDRFKAGAITAGYDRSKIIYLSSRIQPAIDWLKANLREGDVVLSKSATTRRFQRITMALNGVDFRCRIKDCRICVLYCHDCPLANMPESIFENSCIKSELEH